MPLAVIAFALSADHQIHIARLKAVLSCPLRQRLAVLGKIFF